MSRTLLCRVWFLTALIVGASFAGCANPNFFHPGTIEQQRIRASVHDPFPDPDIAPEADGTRPREFSRPLPEPVRNRLFPDTILGR